MFKLITRHMRPCRVATTIATAAFITGALPALAQACTVSSSGGTQAFKQFGDWSSYVLAPGGSFESSTSDWTLNGSSIQTGNESYHINAAADSHALAINAMGSALSAPICVTTETPTFRFFARQTSGTWAQMNVNLLWTDAAGGQHTTTAGSLMGNRLWLPSPILALGRSLPLWQRGDSLVVRLQFLPAQYGGAWAIDDIEVDPYSRR